MNQPFAAAAAFLLALILLGLGRKPKRLFNTGTSAYSFGTQSTLVISPKSSLKPECDPKLDEYALELLNNPKERILLKNKLRKLISAGPEERLIAVQTATEWGDPSILPILRIGLRDIDSRVVLKAAEGIARFRSTTKTVKSKKKESQPLNVSLMR